MTKTKQVVEKDKKERIERAMDGLSVKQEGLQRIIEEYIRVTKLRWNEVKPVFNVVGNHLVEKEMTGD